MREWAKAFAIVAMLGMLTIGPVVAMAQVDALRHGTRTENNEPQPDPGDGGGYGAAHPSKFRQWLDSISGGMIDLLWWSRR